MAGEALLGSRQAALVIPKIEVSRAITVIASRVYMVIPNTLCLVVAESSVIDRREKDMQSPAKG